MISHTTLENAFSQCKETTLFHRYITNNHIEPLIKKLDNEYKVSVLGHSVNQLPIYGIKIGYGSKRILMWSQMHGNESTTTKACFDLFNYFKSFNELLNTCTIYVIPILNPDGAKAYTRFNANNVDLNRDAQDLSQPESKILRQAFNDFKPDFCFNLHGQRTIFSVGTQNKTASASFLAPAQDVDCSVTDTRKKAMDIIVSMNTMLQDVIPNNVGIYDDAFNINCAGDTFQSNNVPTVLFEAGHVDGDYAREEVRKFIFMSMVTALYTIAFKESLGSDYLPYFKIPENKKLFFDIIIRSATVDSETLDIAVQYEEVLFDDNVKFIPKIKDFGDLSQFYGHKEIQANNNEVVLGNNVKLKKENEIDYVLINNKLFSLKLANS